MRGVRASVVALAGTLLLGCGDPARSFQAASPPTGDAGGSTAEAGARPAGRPDVGRADVVEALVRSWYPGRVGDIAVIPDPQAMITYESENNRYMHGGPWPHDSDLPLIMHGARFFRPGVYGGAASHQDIGATVSALLGLPPAAGATGRVLREAFTDGNEVHRPGLVAVLVLDALRADYLEQRPGLLPSLGLLASESARFSEARVNYLPTNTSTAHSTISTATDPAIHGIVGNGLYDRRTGDSKLAYEGVAPYNLMALTFADRWSVATRGRAEIVVQAGTDYPAVALAGHGACILGGHPHWLAYYDSGSGGWRTNDDCYRLPAAVEALDFDSWLGAEDRVWLGHELDGLAEARRSGHFSAFEGATAITLIEDSAFGEDDVTDLFLANLKATDYVSHKYGPFSPEMLATLAEVDAWTRRIVAALEAKAGPGGLALIVTADHGMPDAPASDGLRVAYGDVTTWLNARLDPDGPGVVTFYEGSENQMFLDHERLRVLELEPYHVAEELEKSPVVAFAITEREVREARRIR